MLEYMNAAGMVRTHDDMEELLSAPITQLQVGSIMVDERPLYPGNTFWVDPTTGHSLNARGLPSPGIDYYRKHLKSMVERAHRAGKRFRLSIAGLSTQEFVDLLILAIECNVDEIEVNPGCPNVREGGRQHRIIALSPYHVQKLLRALTPHLRGRKIDLKISPQSDPFVLGKMVSVINRSGIVKVVVSCNTYPNGLRFDEEGKPQITPNNGFGGIGGNALLTINLGQVAQVSKLLAPGIVIYGVGGISCGTDIQEYKRIPRVEGTQVGTHAFNYGWRVLPQILEQCAELPDMEKHLEADVDPHLKALAAL